MSDLFYKVLVIFFEVICSGIFCEIFGEVRNTTRVKIFRMVLLGGCIFLAEKTFYDFYIIRQIVMVLVYSLFVFSHIRVSIWKAFIIALFYETILISTDYLLFIIDTNDIALPFYYEFAGDVYVYTLESGLITLIGKALIFPFVITLKKRLGGRVMEMLSESDWKKLLIFPVFSFIIVSSMLSFSEYQYTSKQLWLSFLSALGLIGMTAAVFYIIDDIVKREMQIHKDRIFKIEVENQTDKYRKIADDFEKQKKKMHEYINQIECIEYLLEKKQYEKLEEYLKKISGRIYTEYDAVDTNNLIVNAVLNTKYMEAKEEGILFIIKINDLSGIRIKDEDMVVILSNLLNNAIEACKKCAYGERRMKLKLVNEDEMIKIGIKNTFNSPVIYEDGEIKSTKLLNREEHGIGIKNIIETIEKYGGSYVITDDEGEFGFSIIIPE